MLFLLSENAVWISRGNFCCLVGNDFPHQCNGPWAHSNHISLLGFYPLKLLHSCWSPKNFTPLCYRHTHTLSHTHTAPLPSILLIIPHREKYAHNNFIMHYMKFMFRYFFHYISSENIAKISLKASRKRTISAPNRVNIYKNQKRRTWVKYIWGCKNWVV